MPANGATAFASPAPKDLISIMPTRPWPGSARSTRPGREHRRSHRGGTLSPPPTVVRRGLGRVLRHHQPVVRGRRRRKPRPARPFQGLPRRISIRSCSASCSTSGTGRSPRSCGPATPPTSPCCCRWSRVCAPASAIERACIVADRGMISAATIAALKPRKIDYILGARERSTAEVRARCSTTTAWRCR